ncbi:baseplate J/gp47 family protein [Vallitaleaceae bacterium 9-2]
MNYDNLPELDFFQLTVNELLEEMINDYESAHKEQKGESITLEVGDPIRIWIQAQANRMFQLAELGNYMAKQNFIRYATGDSLKNKVAFLGVEQLAAKKAKTNIRFYLDEPLQQVIQIPAGTIVSTADNTNFLTSNAMTLSIGQMETFIEAEAEESGTEGNGYLPGQINALVSSVPYVKVVNTVTSYGGADEETDEDLKERFSLVPESFSTAGPGEAYEYFAKSFSTLIQDAKADQSNPGEVLLTILLEDGEVPSQVFLDDVFEFLNDRKRRPLTDHLIVQGPSVVNYSIDVTYYLSEDSDVEATTSKIENAVADFVLWQKSKIGRSRNPSELIRRILGAGAIRVEVLSPTYSTTGTTAIQVADVISVQYGGVESA